MPASFEFWRDQNNCVDLVKDSIWPDQEISDGTRVITHEHIACDSSVIVKLYEVTDMGHTWPQVNTILSEKRVGKVSHEFNASREIVEFLLQFELKE
jgi:poly(3-hydroxybutyrate) depolymerase